MKIICRFTSLLVAILLLVSFAGCTILETNSSAETTSYEDDYPEPSFDEFKGYESLDFSQYLVLPDYSTLSLEIEIVEVTEEDIEEEMADLLATFNTSRGVPYYQHLTVDSEGKPLVLKEKDYVFYHSSARLNGTEVSFLTQKYADVVLEDDEDQLPGFWNQFVGKSVGSTFSFDLSFPEGYYDVETNAEKAATLNGKTVTWTITVQYVAGDKQTPTEFTDEIVKEFFVGDTVEELHDQIKQEMIDENESDAISEAKLDAWQLVSDASTILKYPENSVEYYYQALLHEIAAYADQYSISMNSALTSKGFKNEEAVLQYAKDWVKEYILLYGIIKIDNLDVTSGFEKWLEETAADLGTNVSSLVNYYSSNYGSDYLSMVYSTEVVDLYLLNHINTTRVYIQSEGEHVH